jgi:hypothetical protein
MIIRRSIATPPPAPVTWDERWGTLEAGLVCCWLRGIEKAAEDPLVAAAALRGELPTLAWRGGVPRQIKARHKIGALNYLATWQGLRHEDLSIDTERSPKVTCTRFGVTVTFTGDVTQLFAAQGNSSETEDEDDEPLHATGSDLP